MAISPEQLAKIIGHNSSTLCSPKGDKKLNELKGAMNVDALNSDMVSDEWDNWNFDDPNTQQQLKSQPNLNNPISQNAINNSRMPDAIKQSMLEHNIDTSALGGQADTSFLDNLAAKQKQQYFNIEKLNEIQQP